MKKQSKISMLVLTVFIMFVSMGAFAQEKKAPEKRNDLRIPNLTEAQKTQIQEFRTKMQEESLPIINLINEKKAQLETLSTEKNADINKINAKIDEIGDLKNELAKKRAAFRQNVRSILSDEQRIEYDINYHKKRERKPAPPPQKRQ